MTCFNFNFNDPDSGPGCLVQFEADQVAQMHVKTLDFSWTNRYCNRLSGLADQPALSRRLHRQDRRLSVADSLQASPQVLRMKMITPQVMAVTPAP